MTYILKLRKLPPKDQIIAVVVLPFVLGLDQLHGTLPE